MNTQKMIMAIVATVFVTGIVVLVGLVLWLGWTLGIVVWLGALALLLGVYVAAIRPWHSRWGATDDELKVAMPGDELIPEARPATRAITIAAPAEDIWPWLLQLGFGKAGWYSYDWIDNDFTPSADRILPEYQSMKVGDEILMAPEMGLTVTSIDQPHSIVSVMNDGSTSWCLGLYPMEGGTRLVSRWRPMTSSPAVRLFQFVLIEPGNFIMEHKMLLTIRDRVESAVAVIQR